MPWSPKDATRHTQKATTAKSKRAFAHAANSVLDRTGDEGRAVQAGNAAAARTSRKSKRSNRKSRR